MFTQPFHDFVTRNAFLSEGGVLAVVVGDFHETPHRTRNDTDFPPPLRNSDARLRLACTPPARRNGAPHGRAAGGESDPGFLTAGAPSGRVGRFTSQFTVNPLLGGSLSPQGSLAGRPPDIHSRSRWMSVSACSFVTFLLRDVLLCISMLHRVALPIRVSSQPRQWLQLLRTPMVEAWATVCRPAVFPWPAHMVQWNPMSSTSV